MFQNPFSFNGRIRRIEYGLSVIIYVAGVLLIEFLSISITPILMLAVIPCVWFIWAQGAKRCHDRGNSGWWQIIPFYGFWMLFADGEPNQNEYGYDPKGRGTELVDSLLLETEPVDHI